MSGGLEILSMKEDDVTKMLAAGVHLGDPNINFQMEQYVFKKRPDGTPIINLKKTWEKLVLAARVIAAIENPADICLISNGNFGQRAILKFAKHTGAVPVAGRFTPGTFTNQIQKAFREPRLLVVSDPIADHQPITEASYVNIPTIAFCNTNSPLRHIDVAIPCNGHGKYSQGLMWYMLCREVLRLKGLISRDIPWDVVPDLFFYRDPEEVEKEEQAKQEQMEGQEWQTGTPSQWVDTTGGVNDWGAESFPTTTTQPPTAAAPTGGEDWAMDLVQSSTTKDWGADEDTGDWGGTVTQGTW